MAICGWETRGLILSQKKPVIYDPAVFYAHNEYELGN